MTARSWASILFFVAALLASMALGCKIENWRMSAQIEALKANQARQETQAAQDDLTRYKNAADLMTAAATSAAGQVSAFRAKIQAIQARPYAAPLPVDCHPDSERLRARNDAIDAYNAARTGLGVSP